MVTVILYKARRIRFFQNYLTQILEVRLCLTIESQLKPFIGRLFEKGARLTARGS